MFKTGVKNDTKGQKKQGNISPRRVMDQTHKIYWLLVDLGHLPHMFLCPCIKMIRFILDISHDFLELPAFIETMLNIVYLPQGLSPEGYQ